MRYDIRRGVKKQQIKLKTLIIGVVASAGMVGAFLLLETQSFFVAGIGGTATYVLLLWLTQAVSADEIMSLFSRRDATATIDVEAPLS